MKLGVYRISMFAGLLVVLGGCRGGEPSTEPSPEDTAGGELPATPLTGGADPSGGSSADGGANPWGATRAEQCRRPERTPMSAKARRAFDRGLASADAGDIDAARGHFADALSKDEGAYPALYNLGVLADRAGNEREALDYYARSLRVLPDYEPAARGVATIELRRGDPKDAVAFIEPIASDYRTNLEVQALYAEVLVAAERYDEAWMAARRALKCDERFVPALIALIKASRAQGRDELADSILDQALAIDPNVAELHFMKGESLAGEPGKLRESLQAYERAVELRPDYAEARIALGVQLLAGGNYQEALSHFQAAQAIVPNLAAVHVNLGDAYRALERWTDALRSYERALTLEPDLPEAHFGLGLMYLSAAGDFPGLDEVAAYEKSVEELRTYRREMGPRLPKDDASGEYLRDLDRMIQRAKRRIERDRERAAREAERGPREEGAAE